MGYFILDEKAAFCRAPQRGHGSVVVVFFGGGSLNASQIPKQKGLSVRQRAFESICAELNRPSGKGILEGKGSSLLYDCADVNGIIQILAECMLPAF